MKTTIITLLAAALAIMLVSCGNNDNQFDATGTFEAVETIVSAQANGTIKEFHVEEGQTLDAGQIVGLVDTVQLSLKKKQLEAQMAATLRRRPNIPAEIAALQEDLKQARREQNRISNLVKADAATKKQLDDAGSQVEVIRKKIAAQETSLGRSSSSLTEEAESLRAQIAQIDDQLAKSRIVNEVGGSVLTKYAEQGEMASNGKALYKVADLSEITLRAYVTGEQFATIKIGQNVKVYIDADAADYKVYDGTVQWISSKAEFTPKTIQTKDERANLVYAVKIRVKNDGLLKIGMYGEVKFQNL